MESNENKKLSAENEASRQNTNSSAASMEDRVKKYEDTEGLSTKRLNFGLWFVEKRKYLRLSVIIALIIISATSWSYTIYSFAYYFTRGVHEDELLVEGIVQSSLIGHDYVKSVSAKDLIFSPLRILKTNDKYDILAQIKNPNVKHWGNFAYCFLDKGKEFACANSFIYPGTEKYLLALAQDLTSSPTDIKLVIKDMTWRRINRRVNNWDKFYNEHMGIYTQDIKFTPNNSNNISENIRLSSLEFTAVNKSAFNYWAVNFNILFYNNNSLVGVNRYSIFEFLSGATERVEMNWAGSFSRANKIEVIPEVDILNDDNYIKYEGGIGEEK